MAAQPWLPGADLCRKGWRGMGRERNEETTERNEGRGGKARNETRKSEEEMRRGGGEMRRREEEEFWSERERRSSNVSHCDNKQNHNHVSLPQSG